MSIITVKKVILNDEITNTVQPVVVMGREAELKDYLGDNVKPEDAVKFTYKFCCNPERLMLE